MSKQMIVFGASRGIGAALGRLTPDAGDHVWLVSRSRPAILDVDDGVDREWIQADLSTPEAIDTINTTLQNQRLDVVIYNAGIWENKAWSTAYDFATSSTEENEHIMNVNLLAAMRCLQATIPNLRQSDNGKIILISSINGLPNATQNYVAYAASKFGLRGVAHALRDDLRKDAIGVTCINPGSVMTRVSLDKTADEIVDQYGTDSMPAHDIAAIAKCVVHLSRAVVIKEIDMPAMGDKNV